MDLLEVSPQDFTVKRAATYLKSKAVVLGTRITQDELERAIFKTTSSKNKVPNPKHLKRLIYTSYSSCPSGSQLVNHSTSISTDHEGEEQSNLHMTTDELVARLEKRLHTHDWVVTLKTLIVFHYLLRDGSVELHNAIVHHTSLFHVTKVKDFATADYGRCFSRFITGYTRYMEERCACMRTLQLRVPMDRQRRMEEGDFISSMFQGLSFEKTIEAVGAMLVQLSALITMDIEVPVEENPVALCSLQLIVSDSKRLIAIISDRCVYLLDHASSLTGSNRLAARHTLLEYHKRCRETNFFYGKVTSMMQRCLTSHRQENPIDIYRTLSHSSAENANDTGDVELEPIMLLPTIKEIPIEEIERIFDEQAVQTNTVCKETPSSSLSANGNQCTIAPDIPNHETISLEDFLAKAEEHSKAKEMPGDVFSNVQNLTMQNFAQPSSTISAVQERIEFCNQIAIPTNASSNNTIQNNSGVSKYAELDAFFLAN